jgi:hypothetical protein
MIGHIQAIAQLQAMGGLPDMDIQVSQNYIGEWEAIDRNTYDGAPDSRSAVMGNGKTPLDAIIDLLDQKEEG